MIAGFCAEVLKKQFANSSEKEPLSALKADEDALGRLGWKVVQHYTHAFLRQSFAILTKEAVEQEVSQLHQLSCLITDFLVDTGGFRDNRSGSEAPRPNVVDKWVSMALESATAWYLSDKLLSTTLSSDRLQSVALKLGTQVVDILVAGNELDAPGWASLADDEIDDLCSMCFSRRTTHQSLVTLLTPLHKWIVGEIELVPETLTEQLIGCEPKDHLAFWKEWQAASTDMTVLFGHLVHYMPWDSLNDDDWDQILGDWLSSLLSQTQDEWLVIFKVKGMVPSDGMLSVGPVTFYDPRLYDHGEARGFEPKLSDDNSTYLAKVVVRANTGERARQLAWQFLTHALNIFTFATSVSVRVGGLNPEVRYDDVYYIHLPSGRWEAMDARKRSELSGTQPATENKLKEFASTYDSLLDLAAHDPDQLNELQRKLLQALFWYRKGRWEPDPTEQFLLHWIGFEHIFPEGRDLLSTAAKIHITWLDTDRVNTRLLRDSLQSVAKYIDSDQEIQLNVGISPDLREWREDNRVLLHPDKVNQLIAMTPEANAAAVACFQSHVAHLQQRRKNTDAILKGVQFLRDRFAFRFNLMKNFRNEVVHQARFYSADMEIYAEELEHVLEDILIKMAHPAVKETPQCCLVDDLIGWYQLPWE